METINIFTDGSSLGNPGKGGWGAIIVYDGKVKELGGGEMFTTNNRMELSATIGALRVVPMTDVASTKNSDVPRKIILHADSSYVINGITKWVFGWKKNNWVTSQKKEVQNKDLWEKLVKISEGEKIEWHHVDGHVGVRGNHRADEIAVSFAKGKPEKLFDGNFSEYPIKNILDISHDAEQKKLRISSREHSKTKAYSYLSVVDRKIMRHRTWRECENRIHGKKAKFKKAVSKEDEDKILQEWEF